MPAVSAQQIDIRAPASAIDIHDGVGSEGRDDAPAPARVPNRLMMFQPIGRGVGCRQHLDIEALKQRPRAKLSARQSVFNCIVDGVGIAAVQLEMDAEDLSQFIAEPDARWRRPEEMPVGADRPPDLPMIAR